MTRKPDFIGLGAPKAGTSWIHACLYEHPQIHMPAEKEIHFFTHHYSKGIQWYEDHFRNCRPEQLAGEFSPTYLYNQGAPERIHNYRPEVKLIVCLRNPIKRTVSAYRYAVQTGAVAPSKSFDEVVMGNSAYLVNSLYYPQLERYLNYFDSEQMLILFYEEIANDPYKFIQEIYRFLGVDSKFRPSMVGKRVNVSYGSPRLRSLDRLVKALTASLRKAGMEHIVWAVARSRLGEMIKRLNIRTGVQKPLSETRISELQRLFAPDVQALEQLLQRDLRRIWFDYRGSLYGE